MANDPLLDLASVDPKRVLADEAAIGRHNPQRHEFVQLTRICHADFEAGTVAGVLDIPADVWWARGHCPGRPLMPGVLMLESAAQLCSWFVHQVYDASQHPNRIFGFGGVDHVKFRGIVVPPASMLVVGRKHEIRTRRAVFETQGFLLGGPDGRTPMVFEAHITGMWV